MVWLFLDLDVCNTTSCDGESSIVFEELFGREVGFEQHSFFGCSGNKALCRYGWREQVAQWSRVWHATNCEAEIVVMAVGDVISQE